MGTPKIIHYPNLAQSAAGHSIRAGDPVILTNQYVTNAIAVDTVLTNTVAILGFALADFVYNGTATVNGAFTVPVLIPDDNTHVKMVLNTNTAIDVTASTYAPGVRLQAKRTNSTNAVTTDPFYYWEAVNTTSQFQIVEHDRDSWTSYPTSNSSDLYPYIWCSVVPALRVIL